MAKEKGDRTYPEGGVFNGVIERTVAESLPAPPVPQARTGQRAEYFGPPFEFTGTIVEVTVDVSGKLIPDAEEEKHARARVAMTRQ
jgi:hypothetical protein